MEKRELILVLVAVAVGVYVAADYYLLGEKRDSGEVKMDHGVPTQTLADQAGEKLATLSPAGKGRNLAYIIAKAEAPWPEDPFIRPTEKGDGEDQDDEVFLIYSGFIRAGKTTFGIINGMEYGIGEQLVDLGHKVRQITPSMVILVTRSNREIVLYMEDDQIE